MGRLKRGTIGALVIASLPVAAIAQTPFALDQSDGIPAEIVLGGTPTIDFITLRGVNPGAPLRFGNVIPKSETVQLAGRSLVRSQDYAMDYATGVVYLKVASRPGDVLTVSYRYDKKPAAAPAQQYNGLASFKYTLVPGGLNMLMGFGMTERSAEGKVLSSNVFGFNNSMKFGQGSLKGLFLYGQRQANSVESGMQMDAAAKPGDATNDEGDSTLIVQNYSSKLAGGEISVDYQDISKNFSAFNAAADAGYDAAAIDRLRKERGLTRFGYAMKDVKLGGLGFSNSFRNVNDEAGSIEWRSYGFNAGGLKLDMSSQHVDAGFNRFKDIAEGDREQLMRERGMSRQNLSGEFAQKAGKMSFTSSTIADDATGKSIERRELVLDTSKIKFNLGDQDVASGFNRFESLMGQEKATWGREAGMRRQWMSLQSSLFGAATPISFSQSLFTGATGGFKSQDLAVTGKSWSLTHASRRADPGFASMGAMQDAEIAGHIQSVANMYGPGVAPNGNDRGFWLNTRGLSREYTSVQSQLFKGWNLSASQLQFSGQKDGGKLDTVKLDGKGVSMNYRRQELGSQFGELTSLMEFERQRLGTVAGLDRTDFGLKLDLGRSRNLSVNRLQASVDDAGVKRTSLAYADRKIDVQVNAREVDPTANFANQLLDPEKDLLGALTGFKQRDARVKWQILPNLRVDLFQYDAQNPLSFEERSMRHAILDWSPSKDTQIGYSKVEQHSDDPLSKLFANVAERFTVSRNLGRYGNFRYLNETETFDGKNTDRPDRRTQWLAYETKLDPKTSVRTEQTRTSFSDGNKENVSANTISTAIAKNAGVSLTDVSIDRKGEDRDEKKRNYGFWWDFGNGLRLSYGYARQLNGTDGASQTTFGIGPNSPQGADKANQYGTGRIGDILLGGGYGANTWDAANRTQSFSNLTLSTARALNAGPFRNLQFLFAYDTAADYEKWMRENRLFGFSGQLFGNNVGYEYRSQMAPTGDRGIDRTFKFETPKSETSFLSGSLFYKARTLPWDQEVMVRDFNVTLRPTKSIAISNQMRTNPEVAKGDALLGSVTAADRSNKWRLDFKNSPNVSWGGSWEELINDQQKSRSRTGGVTLKFNEAKGSPVTLFYGVEQKDANGAGRNTKHRYYIQFDQRPGPNQTFSLFAGDVSYEHNWAENLDRNNITIRLDYQLRF